MITVDRPAGNGGVRRAPLDRRCEGWPCITCDLTLLVHRKRGHGLRIAFYVWCGMTTERVAVRVRATSTIIYDVGLFRPSVHCLGTLARDRPTA